MGVVFVHRNVGGTAAQSGGLQGVSAGSLVALEVFREGQKRRRGRGLK